MTQQHPIPNSMAQPAAAQRTPRPLPAKWKPALHRPTTLPVDYPALLDLPGVTSLSSALDIALRAPQLTKEPEARPTNKHYILAQRGDALIRTLLLEVGDELDLTLSGRHDLVAHVGSDAALAQICLESGVLDAAIRRGTLAVAVDKIPFKGAAGIFEAVVAVLYDSLDHDLTAQAIKGVMYPWIMAVIAGRGGQQLNPKSVEQLAHKMALLAMKGRNGGV